MGVGGEEEPAQNPLCVALDNNTLGGHCIEHPASRAFWIFSDGESREVLITGCNAVLCIDFWPLIQGIRQTANPNCPY